MRKEEIVPGLEPFVQEFYSDRVQELISFKIFLENKDFESVAKLSHQWKSFCEPYGFGNMGEMAKNLEEASKRDDYNSCLSLVNDIEDYLDKKKHLI